MNTAPTIDELPHDKQDDARRMSVEVGRNTFNNPVKSDPTILQKKQQNSARNTWLNRIVSWRSKILSVVLIVATIIGGWWVLELRIESKIEAALESINEQVFNHIPTELQEIRAEIRASEQRIVDRMDALFEAYFSDR